MVYILYHNDLDGKCSAFLVLKRLYMGKISNDHIKLIPCDYGNKMFDINNIKDDVEQIWILDYSVSVENMLKLLQITKNIIWIDHHRSAINSYKSFPYEIDGIRKEGDLSACMLTWMYLYTDIDAAPYFIKLISDWDVNSSTHKLHESGKFSYGSLSYEIDPCSNFWNSLMQKNGKIKEVVGRGSIIKNVIFKQNNNLVKNFAFEAEIDGYRCICLNQKGNSNVFRSLKKDYDIKVLFCFDGKRYWVGLYSDKEGIDVSKIACRYGGGGHPGASNFYYKDLSFLTMGVK